MHFYMRLVTVLFPYVVLNNKDNLPPSGYKYVIDYQNRQVVTFNGGIVIAKEV